MKIARKIVSVIITLIISAAFLSTSAFADIGPKLRPLLEIRFTGINGENCWVALLRPEDYYKNNYGDPYDFWDPYDFGWPYYDESEISISFPTGADADAVELAMKGYKDADGFITGIKGKAVEKSILKIGYPPHNFKVLLYFPDSGEFFVTPICECFALNTYYKIDVSSRQNGAVTAIPSYLLAKEIFYLIIRILLTIGMELVIALVFNFTAKKQILLIAVVNVITQIALNIVINLLYYDYDISALMFYYYILLELAVFIVEAILYAALLKTPEGRRVKGVVKAVGYAAAANLVSFIFGLFLFQVWESLPRI